MGDDGYWTYNEWVNNTVKKIVSAGLSAASEDQEDWFCVQIESALNQALRHGRSGRGNDDPVVSVIDGFEEI